MIYSSCPADSPSTTNKNLLYVTLFSLHTSVTHSLVKQKITNLVTTAGTTKLVTHKLGRAWSAMNKLPTVRTSQSRQKQVHPMAGWLLDSSSVSMCIRVKTKEAKKEKDKMNVPVFRIYIQRVNKRILNFMSSHFCNKLYDKDKKRGLFYELQIFSLKTKESRVTNTDEKNMLG